MRRHCHLHLRAVAPGIGQTHRVDADVFADSGDACLDLCVQHHRPLGIRAGPPAAVGLALLAGFEFNLSLKCVIPGEWCWVLEA